MNHPGQRKFLQQPMKRKLLTLLGLTPWLSACQATQPDQDMSDGDLKRKFRGIGGVTITTSSTNRHEYITITSDSGRYIAAPALIGVRGGGILFFNGDALPIPKNVRITWREGNAKYTGYSTEPWLGGTVVGDYTIEVARRIPQEVVDYIRSPRPGNVTGRGLRIKFRLADNGVLFGWDVEEGHKNEYGVFPHFVMAGGDFKEAVIKNGKVITRGWYLTKEGQKIETDF